MKFDAYAALADLRRKDSDSATPATCATPVPEIAHHVAQVAHVARRTDAGRELHVTRLPDFPHGRCSWTDQPRTWTGRIVSLDEWRCLSDWERHGSTNKTWNGLTCQWEDVQ